MKSESRIGELIDFETRAKGRTLSDRAYFTLHAAIISGKLPPGERLPIEDLAKSLDMSPMPVREALRRLDGVGLVELIPHKGATVAELSVEDLVDVYEARLSLEPLASSHAAEHLTKTDEDAARKALAAMKRFSPQNPKLWEAHTRFHFAIYEAAGSRWLLRLITPLWESSERYRTASKQAPLKMRQAEHEAILGSVTDRDPDRAYALMFNHLSVSANHLARHMAGKDVFKLIDVPEPK